MSQSIYIGFSRPKEWFAPYSWIIRLIQWTPYSHVYVRIPSESLGRDLVYQASGAKVNFIGLKRFQAEEVIVKEYQIKISDETKTKILQFAVDNAGANYGMIPAIGLGWVILNSWFGRKIPNPFKDGNSTFFCDELAADIVEEVGIDVPFDPENVGPKEIDQFMNQLCKSIPEQVSLN